MLEHVEVIISIVGFVGSLLAAAVTYGIMSEKVRRLEEDVASQHEECKEEVADIRKEAKSFVTFTHLEAVFAPIREALTDLKADVKELVRAAHASQDRP